MYVDQPEVCSVERRSPTISWLRACMYTRMYVCMYLFFYSVCQTVNHAYTQTSINTQIPAFFLTALHSMIWFRHARSLPNTGTQIFIHTHTPAVVLTAQHLFQACAPRLAHQNHKEKEQDANARACTCICMCVTVTVTITDYVCVPGMFVSKHVLREFQTAERSTLKRKESV